MSTAHVLHEMKMIDHVGTAVDTCYSTSTYINLDSGVQKRPYAQKLCNKHSGVEIVAKETIEHCCNDVRTEEAQRARDDDQKTDKPSSPSQDAKHDEDGEGEFHGFIDCSSTLPKLKGKQNEAKVYNLSSEQQST